MLSHIQIVQENYEKICEIAKNSNSKTELCKKLGWGNSGAKLAKLTKLLNDNNFDHSVFKKQHHKSMRGESIFNNELLLKKAVEECNSYAEVIKFFNRKSSGGTLKTLKHYINQYEISIEHFDSSKRYFHGNPFSRSNNEIFIENSPVGTDIVKKRIIKEKLFEYECSGCGNTGEWCGKKMTLQLEHKNGNNRDHRLENLCFLCPNCHSITDTWGTRNIKGKVKKKNL